MHALRDLHLHPLLPLHPAAAPARAARLLRHLPGAAAPLARVARQGDPREAAPAPGAFADRALFHLRARLRSGAVAGGADFGRGHRKGAGAAVVRFLQRDFNLILKILAPHRRCRPAAAARPLSKQRLEEVKAADVEVEILAVRLRGEAPRPAALLDVLPLFSELVVLGPLLLIREHLVRLADFLKPLLCWFVPRVDIWVVLAGQLPVSLFDLFLTRRLGNTQNLVIVLEPCHPLSPPLRWIGVQAFGRSGVQGGYPNT